MILIGIDPDVHRSGLAIWSVGDQKFLELSDYPLFDLLIRLRDLHEAHSVMVYLEAGHKVKQFWQKKGHGVAKSVGANNEIGRQIEVFMNAGHIPYKLLKPAGYSKYDHKSFCKITGWPEKIRTNPEKRAAGMMVYGRRK